MRIARYMMCALLGAGWGLCGTGEALAEDSRFYMAGYLGMSLTGLRDFKDTATPDSGRIQYRNTPVFAAALGVRLGESVRVEGEISHRKHDLDQIRVGAGTGAISGDVRSTALMINGFYDFDVSWYNLRPYIMAGLGTVWHDGDIFNGGALTPATSGNTLGLAWQVGGGVSYRFSDSVALTGDYRYFGTGDVEMDNANIAFSNHEIRFGVRYDLGGEK